MFCLVTVRPYGVAWLQGKGKSILGDLAEHLTAKHTDRAKEFDLLEVSRQLRISPVFAVQPQRSASVPPVSGAPTALLVGEGLRNGYLSDQRDRLIVSEFPAGVCRGKRPSPKTAL